MCKACVTVEPVRSLGFFVPHLCHKIESRLIDRVQDNKPDRELQYALILLSEVISVRGGLPTAKTETNPILPYVEDICSRVLDKTLNLKQKDEYELAGGILEGLLYNLVHVRQVQIFPAQKTSPPVWVREEFKWAKEGNLENFQVDWYVPGEQELRAVQNILQRYLNPTLETMGQLSRKEIDLEKESVLRNLRQIYRVVYGSSELLAPISTNDDHLLGSRFVSEIDNCPPSTVETIEKLIFALDKGNVRNQVLQVIPTPMLLKYELMIVSKSNDLSNLQIQLCFRF